MSNLNVTCPPAQNLDVHGSAKVWDDETGQETCLAIWHLATAWHTDTSIDMKLPHASLALLLGTDLLLCAASPP